MPPRKRSRQASASSSEDPTTPFSPQHSHSHSPDVKLVHLDSAPDPPPVMKCSLPPHEPLSFASFDDYDVHYHKTHMNRCSECQRNFPDTHFLHLHIAENHDPISAARRDRGEQTITKNYACLIPTCDRLCSTAPKRRMHCIDKHQFPKNYDFFVINDGIDRRSSMLRSPNRRRSSTINSTASASASARQRGESMSSALGDTMDVVQDEKDVNTVHTVEVDDQQEPALRRNPIKLRGRGGFGHPQSVDRGHGKTTSSTDPMDSLTSSMSSLQFIPHSVRMARGRGRRRGQ